MSRRGRNLSLRLLLVVAILPLFPPLAHALIPEPPHVVRGAVRVNGVPRPWGTVTVRRVQGDELLAAFQLGTLPGAPDGFALAAPLDALEPRAPGTARQGDAAQLYLDGAAAAAVTIGGRGESQMVDLALTAPHAIVLIRGPTGTPSPTRSGGAVYLDVEAADTEAHLLTYAWSAACPGADDGAFDNDASRTPVWTAPVAGSTPLSCTLTVAIADGHGLSIEPAFPLTVLATVAPDPVPQFVAGPDPSLCGAQITFDASGSYHSNPERSIALYEWDFDYDGANFEVEATGVATAHGYGARAAPVMVALRVSDDGTLPRSAIATREVHPGGVNRAPVAVAGGPNAVSAGGALALSGLGSTDPDAACGDAIATWEWDLDGDGAFDDAAGPQPVIPWASAQALLCGGRCTHGQSYPIGLRVSDERGAEAETGSTVAVSLVIFAEDFVNGTAAGDPDWLVRSGRWTVLGASAAKKYYASDPVRGGLSVARTARLRTLGSGRLETKLALTRSVAGYANGALVFGYKDNAHYRYVRLQYQQNAWELLLGQVGAIGTDAAGVKRSKPLTGLRHGAWYRLWVDIYDTGRVNVWFRTRTGAPALTHKFRAAAPGRTGYQALQARAYFDNFAAWDRGVLP